MADISSAAQLRPRNAACAADPPRHPLRRALSTYLQYAPAPRRLPPTPPDSTPFLAPWLASRLQQQHGAARSSLALPAAGAPPRLGRSVATAPGVPTRLPYGTRTSIPYYPYM